MPTRVGQNSTSRLQAISVWLQAGASASSEGELALRDRECAAVADLVEQEHSIWCKLQAACNTIELGSPARLRALLSAVTAFAHLPSPVADFPVQSGRQQLYSALLLCIEGLLKCLPPTASQLALTKALRCSNVLHGLSRQLSNLADGRAPLPAARQRAARSPPPTAMTQTVLLSQRLSRSSTLACILACSGHKGIHGARAAANANPDERTRQWRNPYECQPNATPGGPAMGIAAQDAGCKPGALDRAEACGEVQAQEGAAAPEGEPQAGVQASALFVQELVAAFCSSGLVEHASRAMLLLAGRLQQLRTEAGRGGGAGREAAAWWQQLETPWSDSVAIFSGTYQRLSTLTSSPGLLGAPTTSAAAHHLDPALVAPLGAAEHQLDPEHLQQLRRVLSGPCTRHLVLCMGLRTLCLLDGGPTYGLPEAAGLQQLPIMAVSLPGQYPAHPGQLLLHSGPLHNLLTLLAMQPGDAEDGEQDGAGPASPPGAAAATAAAARPRGVAVPPGRGTRLQLTLRVARAVASAAAKANNRGGRGGNPTYAVVDPTNDAHVAVQALHLGLARAREREF